MYVFKSHSHTTLKTQVMRPHTRGATTHNATTCAAPPSRARACACGHCLKEGRTKTKKKSTSKTNRTLPIPTVLELPSRVLGGGGVTQNQQLTTKRRIKNGEKHCYKYDPPPPGLNKHDDKKTFDINLRKWIHLIDIIKKLYCFFVFMIR